jgi:hypothetical protein
MYREWKKIEFPKRVLYMNLGTTRLRGKPRNRWQDEVGEGWKNSWCRRVAGNVYNREEWKKLLRTARNRRILHKPMNETVDVCHVCIVVPKLQNATVRLTMPIPLSVCPSATNNLSRNVCGFFENLLKINISLQSDNNSCAVHQTTLHLRYHLAEYFL